MKRQKLTLHKTSIGNLRAVFKTRHGRIIFMLIRPCEGDCLHIEKCYYVDRNKSGQHNIPQKFKSRFCTLDNLTVVIAKELDRNFYGVEVLDDENNGSNYDFITEQLKEMQKGYKFLIFSGEGKLVNGLPCRLKTRLKNRIHRAILLELNFDHDNLGVVSECYYYDRTYKSRTKVMPETLTSVFFEYNRKTIISLVNHELNCDFTDVIFLTDQSIDIENNIAPLCGNI